MNVVEAQIPGVRLIGTPRHDDGRGFFSEAYSRRSFALAGIDIEFVQDNHSHSVHSGTVRGLHFQVHPFAQDKLIRVVRGAIFDVAVDLRHGSPTLGQHVSVVLSAAEDSQVLVPVGFAHGFCTLEPETEIIYKVSNYYAPDCEGGVLWNDPDLGIVWPVKDSAARLSPKDKIQPRLAEVLGGLDRIRWN